MTDKKLTDEEIIKGLECCLCDGSECLKCQDDIKNICRLECNKVATETINFINRRKAEVERYKRYYYRHEYDKWEKEIKTEAYKEFAEKLKEEMRLEDDCDYNCRECYYECKEYVITVDNLLKEMVGEEE